MRKIGIGIVLLIILMFPIGTLHATAMKDDAIVQVRDNNVAAVRLLLEQGENPNNADKWGRTLLIIAVQRNQFEMVDLLLANGAHVNAANKNDITALITAVQMQDINTTYKLLKAGAQVNHQDKMGWTALMWATYKENREIVNMLLEFDADPRIANNRGQTAIYLADQVIKRTDIAQILTDRIADYFIGSAIATPTAPVISKVIETNVRFNPVIDSQRWSFGNKDAPITIVEYTDFQCPYCIESYWSIQRLLQKYPGKVRLIIKHTPSLRHDIGKQAALYFEALAATDTTTAWEFYNFTFSHQDKLKLGDQGLQEIMGELKIDLPATIAKAKQEEIKNNIDNDLAEAMIFGFEGVPVVLINGYPLYGAATEQEYSIIIEDLLTGVIK